MKNKKNKFKEKILKKEKQIGIWSCLTNNTIAEIISITGFDWSVIDMEHSPNDIQEVLTQLQVMEGYNTEPVVRVPWNEPVITKRVLDMGAQTILFPFVQNKNEAITAVEATRYPPKGVRGVMSAARMNRYGHVENYYTDAEKEICVLIQCETKEAIKNIPDIAKVDGIDGIFIGASQTKELRNAMIVTVSVYIVCSLFFVDSFGNTGLWISLCIFFALRALSLFFYLPRIYHRIS